MTTQATGASNQFLFYRLTEFKELEEREEAVARSVVPFRLLHHKATPISWTIASKEDSRELVWFYGVSPECSPSDAVPIGACYQRLHPDTVAGLHQDLTVSTRLSGVFTRKETGLFSDELRDAALSKLAAFPFAITINLAPVDPTVFVAELRNINNHAHFSQSAIAGQGTKNTTAVAIAADRYDDLVEAAQFGGWQIQATVSSTPQAQHSVNHLACSTLSIDGLTFEPTTTSALPSDLLPIPTQDDLIVSSQQLGWLNRQPRYELPGIALRPQMPFHINPEPAHTTEETDDHEFVIGSTLDHNNDQTLPFSFSAATLNRHALVCGATGSGKTQTVKQLLQQLTDKQIPWLVIEPAKAEYRELTASCDVHVIRVGDITGIPVSLNPLEPEPGFPLRTHIDMIAALFQAAFTVDDPFPQILNAALQKTYTDLGWNLTTGQYKTASYGPPENQDKQYPRYPTLEDLQNAARTVVDEIGYGKEVRDNIHGLIDIRLGSLVTGTPGQFFANSHHLDLNKLLQNNVVIELEDVGNDTDKAFITGVIITRFYQHLRAQGPKTKLQHVTVIEEAHRLLRNQQGETNQAVEVFAAMLSEIRAYGEGLVIAEQIPTKIIPDVIKNTAIQIVHRLPGRDDRDILAGAMNMTDQQHNYITQLKPGQAATNRQGMDQPVLTQIKHTEAANQGGYKPSALEELIVSTGSSLRYELQRLSTGGEVAEASRLLAAFPQLGLWVEAAFLMTIAGYTPPSTGPSWRSQFINGHSNAQLKMCVTATVTQAVSLRWPQIADHYDPNELIRHLVDVTSKAVGGEDPEQASQFWIASCAVKEAVKDLRTSPETFEPEPFRMAGIDIPDASVDIQQAWLEQSKHFNYRHQHTLTAGTSSPELPNRLSYWTKQMFGHHDKETIKEALRQACQRADRTWKAVQDIIETKPDG